MTDLTPIKQIKATALPNGVNKSHLSSKKKAVIVIKFLINHGADLPLNQLPETLQIDLIHQMAAMPPVDQNTLADVIVEFANELDSVGLFFFKRLGRSFDRSRRENQPFNGPPPAQRGRGAPDRRPMGQRSKAATG